ncbi:EipA family protein [uncultured Brevundimonas sp.]|uniref:EipA family protein n=1 Tax=uncultured Brevundimonas sp. TaxID=213418 RepID=UPI0030ECBC5E|tara:strand:+ start:124445 stop:125062 length:618 start_codon:yes stop_codon:yes gene_type:complete
MHRRQLILSGLAATAAGSSLTACATNPRQSAEPNYPISSDANAPAYTADELIAAGSRELGIAAEAMGGAIERVFAEQGDRPTAYIAGEEGAGAAGIGLRYGRGALHMKDLSASQDVFWQGISIGWDIGGNASRVFTLVYGLYRPDMIYRRFPGVEGSAYLIGGLGVNYQRADGITLAPIRTGVGLRLGANVGTMAYSRQRNLLPF